MHVNDLLCTDKNKKGIKWKTEREMQFFMLLTLQLYKMKLLYQRHTVISY